MTDQLATLFDHLPDVEHPLGRRATRARLCPEDERILDIWAEVGVPADLSTVEHACDLLMVAWRDLKELRAYVAEAQR